MERSPWAEIIGPVYSEESVLRELSMDAVQLERAVRWSQILRLTTVDGYQVYPAWQIGDGAVVDGLQPVIETLRTGIEDPWTWAQWLCTRIDEVEGGDGLERHIDRLAAGRLAEVLRTRGTTLPPGRVERRCAPLRAPNLHWRVRVEALHRKHRPHSWVGAPLPTSASDGRTGMLRHLQAGNEPSVTWRRGAAMDEE